MRYILRNKETGQQRVVEAPFAVSAKARAAKEDGYTWRDGCFSDIAEKYIVLRASERSGHDQN